MEVQRISLTIRPPGPQSFPFSRRAIKSSFSPANTEQKHADEHPASLLAVHGLPYHARARRSHIGRRESTASPARGTPPAPRLHGGTARGAPDPTFGNGGYTRKAFPGGTA